VDDRSISGDREKSHAAQRYDNGCRKCPLAP